MLFNKIANDFGKNIITITDKIIASTMTSKCLAIPIAVITESKEKTMSKNMISIKAMEKPNAFFGVFL